MLEARTANTSVLACYLPLELEQPDMQEQWFLLSNKFLDSIVSALAKGQRERYGRNVALFQSAVMTNIDILSGHKELWIIAMDCLVPRCSITTLAGALNRCFPTSKVANLAKRNLKLLSASTA